MNKYRVVMGFHPSKASAEKVLTKAKAKCRNPHIVAENGCFVLVLFETNSEEEAGKAYSYFMRKKLYCGVQVKGKEF